VRARRRAAYWLAAEAGGIGAGVDGVVVDGVVLGVVDGIAGSAGRLSQAASEALTATSAAIRTLWARRGEVALCM
jgi:hypothetical protein